MMSHRISVFRCLGNRTQMLPVNLLESFKAIFMWTYLVAQQSKCMWRPDFEDSLLFKLLGNLCVFLMRQRKLHLKMWCLWQFVSFIFICLCLTTGGIWFVAKTPLHTLWSLFHMLLVNMCQSSCISACTEANNLEPESRLKHQDSYTVRYTTQICNYFIFCP